MVCEKSFFFYGISKHTIPKLYASATDIACDGDGVADQGGCDSMLFPRTSLDIPGCWIIATCKVWVLSRPSKLFLYFLCRPASSIQAPPPPLPLWSSSSFAFVKLLCLRLWTQGWVFWGHTGVQNWVCWAKLGSKLRLLGQNWCVNWCSNCFCSANLVSRFVYWVKLVSKVWSEYSKPL